MALALKRHGSQTINPCAARHAHQQCFGLIIGSVTQTHDINVVGFGPLSDQFIPRVARVAL